MFAKLRRGCREGRPGACAAAAATEKFLSRLGKISIRDAARLVRGKRAPPGDEETLVAIRDACVPPKPKTSAGRARSRVEEVRALFEGAPPRAEAYLDVGCSEGSLTTALGELFGATEVHGCDVRSCSGAGFVFRTAPAEKLPYADCQFDVVSFVMALHHVRDIPRALAEARRVLAPGGLLLVREHDCPGPDFAVFLDIVHLLYAVLGREIALDAPGDLEKHTPKFVTRYMTRAAWAEEIAKAGFEPTGRGPSKPHDRFRGYCEIFRRP